MSYYSEAREYHEQGKYKEAYTLYEQGAKSGDESKQPVYMQRLNKKLPNAGEDCISRQR